MYAHYRMSKDNRWFPKFSSGEESSMPSMGMFEKKGRVQDMGDTLILAFPLIIGGMLWVIIWGMSAAGIRHNQSDRTHSRTI